MEGYVQQALDIVKAQASVRNMTEEEITSMVQSLSQQLKGIVEGNGDQAEEQKPQEPAADPKKAIREKAMVAWSAGRSSRSCPRSTWPSTA